MNHKTLRFIILSLKYNRELKNNLIAYFKKFINCLNLLTTLFMRFKTCKNKNIYCWLKYYKILVKCDGYQPTERN